MTKENPIGLGVSMFDATHTTICALQRDGELTERDCALARLAYELADRIDTNGLNSYASVYSCYLDCILALRHECRAPLITPTTAQP